MVVPCSAFDDARSRANPFEGIKKEFFVNRAALKMAAMDAAFDGLFSFAEAPSPAKAYAAAAVSLAAASRRQSRRLVTIQLLLYYLGTRYY